MPDTTLYRRHANECERLSREVDGEHLREIYRDIAARWRRLASEIEGAESKTLFVDYKVREDDADADGKSTPVVSRRASARASFSRRAS